MSTQSLIKDEARNLADNARSSTEQIATLVSVAGKQTDAAIAEAVERMISDAAKNQKASAVSYTHLDVYKRQCFISSKPMTPPVVSRSSLVEGTLLGIP